MMSKLQASVNWLEKTKLGQQLFRVVRIVVVGIVASIATGNPVTVVAIVAAIEAAFRQVFPGSAGPAPAPVAPPVASP